MSLKELPAIDDLLLRRHLKEQARSDAIEAERERRVEQRMAQPLTADDVYEMVCDLLIDTRQAEAVRHLIAQHVHNRDALPLLELLITLMDTNRRQRAETWARDEVQ